MYRDSGPLSGKELGEGDRRTMATSIRSSKWLAGGIVLLIISAVWAQSRGTSEDESAVRALIPPYNARRIAFEEISETPRG